MMFTVNHQCTVYVVYRVLVKHMTPFKKESKSVIWHLPHKYSLEMKTKSTVVSTLLFLR